MPPCQPAPRADVALVAARALVVLFLGLGLLLMHHVVGAPHESSESPAPAAVATGVQGAHSGHGTGAPDDSHGEHDDHGSMLLHLCLAVLAAAVSVAALVLSGHLAVRTGGDDGPEGGLVVAPVPRPPPVPDRLALLQVLRL